MLLLAKTLGDLGWVVEHEPEEAGGTPDLRISRNGYTYLVEVIRVTRQPPSDEERALFQIRDALRAVRTTTPLILHSVRVPGNASLKPFVRYIKDVLSRPPPEGHQVFEGNGVRISYEVRPPLAQGMEVPAAAFLPVRVLHGGGHELVRAALNTKLERYKTPLIVALDLFDLSLSFATVEDVLFGERVITFDFDPKEGTTGEGRLSRSDSGLLMSVGHSGARARERLVGVLPFRLSGSAPDGSWMVNARLLANPAREPLHDFAEFAPIPRLVVHRESEGVRHLRYRTGTSADAVEHEDDKQVGWSHQP
ncbi:MAG TPA: hypothetical protein VE153_37810 [Myxococcus sp.]|nr:hypothetical protein [Myxococcus sp.]